MCDPILISSIISAGATLAGGAIQKSSAEEAAAEQRRVQEANNQMFIDAQKQAMAVQQPFIDAGRQSLSQLQGIANQQGLSPMAQQQLQDAERGNIGQLAASGNLFSGGGLDTLARSRERVLANEQSQRQSILGGIAGLGASASQAGSGILGQFPQQQAFTGGIMGGGQAMYNGINQLGNIALQTGNALALQNSINNAFGLGNQNQGVSKQAPLLQTNRTA